MFDPWAAVERHPGMTVHIQRLEGGVVGLTDGRSRIWLDDRLSQVEQRCTLTHELVHLWRRHQCCQPLRVELDVCAEAARRLIPLESLARVVPWAYDLHEMAEELVVTPQTLRDRLMGMGVVERSRLTALGARLQFDRAA